MITTMYVILAIAFMFTALAVYKLIKSSSGSYDESSVAVFGIYLALSGLFFLIDLVLFIIWQFIK